MTTLFFLVAIYGGLFLVGWLVSKISNLLEKHREKVKDGIVNEIFVGMNPNEIIDQYQKKIEVIKFTLRNEKDTKYIENYVYSRFPKYYRLLGQCPKCNNGHLVRKSGKNGIFIGCSRYPKCEYIISIKNLKKEFGEKTQETFLIDFKKAYDLDI